jgi:hypothetical protein
MTRAHPRRPAADRQSRRTPGALDTPTSRWPRDAGPAQSVRPAAPAGDHWPHCNVLPSLVVAQSVPAPHGSYGSANAFHTTCK